MNPGPVEGFIERLERAPEGHGPLDGLSFGLKDLYDVEGRTAGGGNPDWARTHGPAASDCPVLQTLLGAGARLAGMTHTDELALSLSGTNAHYGTPLNAAAPDRVPGGSSSGSASVTAAGLADFAIGTDTGGSVRVPAAHCGLFGIRPSHGVISLAGCIPLAPSYDTCGWFARDAGMLARVGAVLLDAAPVEAGELRFCVDPKTFAHCETATARHLEAQLGALDRLGPVETVDTGFDAETWRAAYLAVQCREIMEVHSDWLRAADPAFGPDIAARFEGAKAITADQAAAGADLRRVIRARLHDLLAGGRVLVTPTAPGPAPLISAGAEAHDAFVYRALALTALASHAGVPEVTVPAGRIDGGPVGLSLIAAPMRDTALLAMAGVVAAALSRGT